MTVTRFMCILLGLIFALSGYLKLQDPQGFALMVANHQILPQHLVRAAAQWLAWLELVCGLCLVFGVCVRGASLTLTALLIIFLTILGYNVQRGLDVACGCFSTDPNGPPVSALTLSRDLLILVLAMSVFISSGIDKRRPYLH